MLMNLEGCSGEYGTTMNFAPKGFINLDSAMTWAKARSGSAPSVSPGW